MAFFGSRDEAIAAAREEISRLTEASFVRTIYQANFEPFDLFAVIRDGGGWYLKYTVDVDVFVISLHPLENAVRTARGRLIEP